MYIFSFESIMIYTMNSKAWRVWKTRVNYTERVQKTKKIRTTKSVQRTARVWKNGRHQEPRAESHEGLAWQSQEGEDKKE
jgi:hypothetical protein